MVQHAAYSDVVQNYVYPAVEAPNAKYPAYEVVVVLVLHDVHMYSTPVELTKYLVCVVVAVKLGMVVAVKLGMVVAVKLGMVVAVKLGMVVAVI